MKAAENIFQLNLRSIQTLKRIYALLYCNESKPERMIVSVGKKDGRHFLRDSGGSGRSEINEEGKSVKSQV